MESRNITKRATCLSVGIDFGASKTVLSFLRSSDDNIRPHLLSLRGDTIIPTVVAYPSKEPCVIGKKALQYPKRISWLKHILYESSILDNSNKTLVQDLVKLAIDRLPREKQDNPYLVVADFLGTLLQHFQTFLEGYPDLKTLPRVYTFTIPATWSEHARSMMLNAAQQAGYGRQKATIRFTTEADAVAVYAANKSGLNMGQFSQVNDGVIICDCGASTIDLTAFYVDQTSPSFECQMLAASNSRICGALELQYLVYDRLSQFRSTKGIGIPNPGVPFARRADFNFPAGSTSNIDLNVLSIDSTVKDELYDTLIRRIVCYIRNQIDCASLCVGRDKIRRLLLVGGMTVSDEISTKFRSILGSDSKITVYQPPEPIDRVHAVSFGATLCGIRQTRLSFKFWKHYYMVCSNWEELLEMFPKGHSFDDGTCRDWRITLPRSGEIEIVESAEPLSLKHVGKITCDFTRVSGNWQLVTVLVNCRATVRFEDQDFPCERMLHLAVYHGEGLNKRLVAHKRLLMQGMF
ncbi:Hsp70 family protein [Aspergillus homomorphus CBS 101889]|uniref:Actin-like ATPase domain-containing protein n=1 Tax=Aspergillus homomorphus (strain CBS 101889) TaxID=1450537 RepID=A0A395HRG9_ASPHC|nr:hypothetical protein BO97DRAFT_456530 [Aspergillus homomorphus CBS 101889]RAL10360.1 hypothetical protein BO97DRAFT_456530 [Aspergillus homomorphus CBS 101889]